MIHPTKLCFAGRILIGVFTLLFSRDWTLAWQPPQRTSALSPEEKQRRAQEADRWNQEGLRLFAEGRFAKAAEAFKKVYELYPNVPDVGYNLGLAYQQAGKYEESINPLQKSLDLRPNDPVAERALGVSLLNLNRGKEGVEQLKKSLEGDSRNVDTLYYLSLGYYGLKEFDRAEQCLRWMFERNADSALLRLRTANAHRINRRYQEALAELRKAEALDPNVPSLYLELGLTYIGLKDTADAQAAIEEEIRRHPGSAEAHLTLGELLVLVSHNYLRALESIRQAQELGIAPIRADFDLGEAYFGLNQLSEAERYLQQAVNLDPKHRRAQYLLAKVYQREGKTDLAKEHFAVAELLDKQEQAELVTSFRTMVEAGKVSK